jgi:hypothetical protein
MIEHETTPVWAELGFRGSPATRTPTAPSAGVQRLSLKRIRVSVFSNA